MPNQKKLKLRKKNLEKNMTVKTKTVKVDNNGVVLLSAFSEWVDVKRVKFYSLRVNKDKSLTLKFFDRNRKQLKPMGYRLLPRPIRSTK